MKTTILIINLLFITLTSCNNDDNGFTPTLPPATQSGENTFGCYVDGKLLTPRDGTGTYLGADRGMQFLGLGTPPNYTYNEIKVRDFKSGNGGIIIIHFNNLHQNNEGVFDINQSNCQDGLSANNNINITCRLWNEETQEFEWFCSVNNTGKLTVTKYNFENRLLSGTFSCSVVNQNNPNDIIEITEGRFDIKWDTLPNTTFP